MGLTMNGTDYWECCLLACMMQKAFDVLRRTLTYSMHRTVWDMSFFIRLPAPVDVYRMSWPELEQKRQGSNVCYPTAFTNT